MSGKVHDRELLDELEALPIRPYSSTAWRTAWKKRDPLIGSTGGGRWDPPSGSFEVLYTSTESNGSIAEIYYHLSQAPVFSTCDVVLHKLKVHLERVLTFDENLLIRFGIEHPLANRLDHTKTQEISGAVRFLEYQGMIVPNARWNCTNLVIFMDQIDLNEAIEIEGEEDINWPAWKENNKNDE